MKLLDDNNLNKDRLSMEYHPFTFAAMMDNDNPKFHEAMNGPHSEDYYKAMEEEMEILKPKMDPWEIVPRIKVGDNNVLDTTWAYKAKNVPNWTSLQVQGLHFCLRGSTRAWI